MERRSGCRERRSLGAEPAWYGATALSRRAAGPAQHPLCDRADRSGVYSSRTGRVVLAVDVYRGRKRIRGEDEPVFLTAPGTKLASAASAEERSVSFVV